jgi:hypothetical protein
MDVLGLAIHIPFSVSLFNSAGGSGDVWLLPCTAGGASVDNGEEVAGQVARGIAGK